MSHVLNIACLATRVVKTLQLYRLSIEDDLFVWRGIKHKTRLINTVSPLFVAIAKNAFKQ